MFRKDTKTPWTDEQLLKYQVELQKELQRQTNLNSQSQSQSSVQSMDNNHNDNDNNNNNSNNIFTCCLKVSLMSNHSFFCFCFINFYHLSQ